MGVRNGEPCIDADEYMIEQANCCPPGTAPWDWRLLPETLIYPAYLAGVKESRFGGIHFFDNGDLFEEGILGAHVGIVRYGNTGNGRPEGWQWDAEGAATPRLNLDDQFDLQAVDFRIGTFLSYGEGRVQYKFGYYHLSSHVGDEFLIKHPSFYRINSAAKCWWRASGTTCGTTCGCMPRRASRRAPTAAASRGSFSSASITART